MWEWEKCDRPFLVLAHSEMNVSYVCKRGSRNMCEIAGKLKFKFGINIRKKEENPTSALL